jgi:hypothetical protein
LAPLKESFGRSLQRLNQTGNVLRAPRIHGKAFGGAWLFRKIPADPCVNGAPCNRPGHTVGGDSKRQLHRMNLLWNRHFDPVLESRT